MYIPGQYGGYNFAYDPKTRVFHQFRAIGEETAAQRGYNFDTISICIIGNYSRVAGTTVPVDPMTETIERDIAKFIYDLIEGDHDWLVVTDTKIDLSITRVHPHRFYQMNTECYGMALNDRWITDVLARYTRVPAPAPDAGELKVRIKLLQQLVSLYLELAALIQRRDSQNRLSSSHRDHSCEGFINL